ncbi:MAG: hypothetical protein M3Y27_04115 [Acidobacteriota bacterium]|nr:hypothetical protein [Acidobacteriota bacterium]
MEGYAVTNSVAPASGRVNNDQFVFRGDHTFSDQWKLFARYSYSNVDTFTPSAIPGFAGTASMGVQDAALGSTYIFGPKTFFDVRLGYNRENAINSSQQIGIGNIAQFGIPGVAVTPLIDGIPSVSVTGFSGIGDLTNAPEGRVENSEQIQANFSHIVGRHTLKVGGNIWLVQLNRIILSAYDRGVYSFTNAYTGASTGLPDFLLGMMLSSNRQEGFIREDAVTTMYNFYGGDDFRINRRLTISLGLRYELRPAYVDKHNHIATWLPQNGGRFVVAGDPNNGFTGRAEVTYLGNKGTSLDGVRRLNQGALPSGVNPAYYRPDPNFGLFTVMDSFGDSNYESLQSKLTRRFPQGMTSIAGYTYGHAIDNANGEGGGSGSSLFAQDTNNLRAERGNSDYDVRHRFTLAAVYELPFGPDKRFQSDAKGIVGKMIGGWEATAIYQARRASRLRLHRVATDPLPTHPMSERTGCVTVIYRAIKEP